MNRCYQETNYSYSTKDINCKTISILIILSLKNQPIILSLYSARYITFRCFASRNKMSIAEIHDVHEILDIFLARQCVCFMNSLFSITTHPLTKTLQFYQISGKRFFKYISPTTQAGEIRVWFGKIHVKLQHVPHSTNLLVVLMQLPC